jgi:dihydroorotate dehydrogenase subfamily 1
LNTCSLKTCLAGLELESPTALASGILGYSHESLHRITEAGAGAVVTKSVGLKPRMGYPNPTVVQANCGIINAMGLPNPGIAEYSSELRFTKTVITVPLIVSVYGYSAEEYAEVAKAASAAGADAVELNVSCPHVKETVSSSSHRRGGGRPNCREHCARHSHKRRNRPASAQQHARGALRTSHKTHRPPSSL